MKNQFQYLPLARLVTPVERSEVPEPGKLYRQIGVRLWGGGAYERELLDGADTKYKTLSRIEKDDIIVNKIWARNGSVAVVTNELTGTYASTEFPAFSPNKDFLEPRWFHWLTKIKWFWHQCDLKSRGTSGKNRIRPEKFLEIEIPLPPLPEQRRIVEKIEELAAKIDEARNLRQDADQERDMVVDAALKVFKDEAFKVNSTRISKCSSMSTGTTPPSKRLDYYEGQINWYTPGDLSFDKELGPSSRTITEKAVQDNKARIFKPGTVLLVAIGASLGKVALTHERCSTNQQITGIKFFDDVLAEYGFWWIRSLRKELKDAAPQATLPIINQKRIGEFSIAILPKQEQKLIVDYLDGLQEKVEKSKQLQEKTAAELDALLPSILDKAFRGELVD